MYFGFHELFATSETCFKFWQIQDFLLGSACLVKVLFWVPDSC
jgi:hypothetical protein